MRILLLASAAILLTPAAIAQATGAPSAPAPGDAAPAGAPAPADRTMPSATTPSNPASPGDTTTAPAGSPDPAAPTSTMPSGERKTNRDTRPRPR